ncbi:uncharacterized protein METZ01_LOCUS364894 [marine metagenome]|uniref:Uncharacterized protein n=1 Tax=marine metagenome TaxID=408172 RepID=A0A382SQ04_9ZZZZ
MYLVLDVTSRNTQTLISQNFIISKKIMMNISSIEIMGFIDLLDIRLLIHPMELLCCLGIIHGVGQPKDLSGQNHYMN